MNYSEAYRKGTDVLTGASIPEAALDARLLLEFVTGNDTNTLYAHPDTPVSDEDAAKYEELILQRARHIPLSYITGTCSFMGVDFTVNENVLIPRQDTECLVEEAMRFVSDGSGILDLCTGSGCILLALMHYKNGCNGVGVDISASAVDVARKNAAMIDEAGGLNGGSVSFVCGDLYEPLQADGKKFDVIISNPPYIKRDVIETLMPEVRDHEPREALDGGEDGLSFYRRIAEGAPEHLVNYGMVFLEIGYDQGEAVSEILKKAGFTDINVVKDYGGNDRVITAVHKIPRNLN